VHKGLFAAKLVSILLAAACSAVVEPPTLHTTANVDTGIQSGGVQRLDFDSSVNYPMLHYESTGVRRMSHAPY
jgi:hypothetical protein